MIDLLCNFISKKIIKLTCTTLILTFPIADCLALKSKRSWDIAPK